MGLGDRRPLQGTPTTARIARVADNRLGAVYSALHAFWSSRASAQAAAGQAGLRRDAYSVILFDHQIVLPVQNDFRSDADTLLTTLLQYGANGGTDYDQALQYTQVIMENNWSTDRYALYLCDTEYTH
jgi:hypothetical protein